MFRGLWNTSKILDFFLFSISICSYSNPECDLNLRTYWCNKSRTCMHILTFSTHVNCPIYSSLFTVSQGLYDLNEANSARFIFRNMFFKVHYYVKIKIKVDTFFRVAIKWPHYLGILFSQRNLFKCHFLNITSKLTFNV